MKLRTMSRIPFLMAVFLAIHCDGSQSSTGDPAGMGGAGVPLGGQVTGTGGGTTVAGSGGAIARSGGSPSPTGGTAVPGTGGLRLGGSQSLGGAGAGGAVTGGARTGGVLAGGGTAASGGALTNGGSVAGGGMQTTGGSVAGTGGTATPGGTPAGGSTLPKFSFFVTSIEAMRELSKNQNGFGGDFRFGEATGLAGADKICRTIAEKAMPGAGAKGWAAFLSATQGGPGGGAVNAIDRVGNGPWYDRLGRVVAKAKTDLASARPVNCDPAICDDLPNENGVPNHQGVDNHDMLTGSNSAGKLTGTTCNDWTSSAGNAGKPMLGHAWPARSGQSWLQAHAAGGCAPGVNLAQTGGVGNGTTVGSGGGYGGIYCFALQP